MPAISFQHVTKQFGTGTSTGNNSTNTHRAVDDVTLDIEAGEFVVLLGPSGCGKTTLMRMANRLIDISSGEIFLGGTEVHQIPVTQLRRQIGYVIQQVGLFPHMTVAQNIAVVPKLLGWKAGQTRARADELLELVDLAPDVYRDRYPRQLSGGQQQRVGIARAMAADPAYMLMDEPFGAIDAITRTDLQDELLAIQRKVGKTVIFVTHDVEEALRLADRIAIMRDGKVVQYDTPFNLLIRPADEFVSALLGDDDVFRQLSLIPVTAVMTPGRDRTEGDLAVRSDASIRSALSALIAGGATALSVLDAAGEPVGILSMRQILREGANPHDESPRVSG